ncbi:hypothetical protein PRZ48_005795 [Zasmidium cellare]|uniref:Uncharacterized protein n=1 Tax=Zasmidium cellare TaxID=395010 RepID=A0ABR0ELJ7_ZASCE|nr:hypothetical protein PRZ48_005795 [Zasmidium cellare]
MPPSITAESVFVFAGAQIFFDGPNSSRAFFLCDNLIPEPETEIPFPFGSPSSVRQALAPRMQADAAVSVSSAEGGVALPADYDGDDKENAELQPQWSQSNGYSVQSNCSMLMSLNRIEEVGEEPKEKKKPKGRKPAGRKPKKKGKKKNDDE